MSARVLQDWPPHIIFWSFRMKSRFWRWHMRIIRIWEKATSGAIKSIFRKGDFLVSFRISLKERMNMEQQKESKNTQLHTDANKSEKKKKKWTIPQILIMAVCVCVFLGSALYLGNYYLQIKHAQDQVSDLRDLALKNSIYFFS